MKVSLDSLTRPDPGGTTPPRRMPAWLIPAAILTGFGLLFLALFRDRLLPAPSVETALVLATPGGTETAVAAEGRLLFQASGWIEPDPLPVKATALVDGVIDLVHVLEGQRVAKDEPLATLVDADAQLALAAAEQKHRTRVAAYEAQIAAIGSARKKLESAKAIVQVARTLQEEAADQNARISELGKGAISESEIVTARLRLDRERLQTLAAEALSGEAEAEVARMELESKVKEAEAAAAAVAVDQAKLALERTRILSPVNGRVLRLLAAPGQKKMLAMDDTDSSTIAILYQPDHLQVRVDVPLADAAGLSVGQPAKIRCSLLPEQVFDGEVTRLTGEADLQRNTLQAKVRILDPVDQLRPEMLCRVEFFGKGQGATAASLATWAPEAALTGGTAWVFDPDTMRVARRAVQASTETRDGFVRVLDGLRPGEQVVLSPQGLRDGQRVNPEPRQP
jgi:RND family efflux transporter MFP subunit